MQPEGTVTILFTDVEGSTDLRTSRGDDAAHAILRAQESVLREQVQKHGGHEIKSMGDGFMVAFGSARKAIACAIDIQLALEDHNRRLPGREVLVRMGLNTGEVTTEDGDLYGAAVNAAARIAAKAKGGQILVSDIVKQLAGAVKNVNFVDRGRWRLKGFPERWRLHEIAWRSQTPATKPLVDQTAFVGRDTERGELASLLDRAASGNGVIAVVGGEPGVGKTRLAEEMGAEAARRGMIAATGRCFETETQPFLPLTEALDAIGRAITDDELLTALGDKGAEVARLWPDLRRRFPDLPAGIDLPAEQERRYVFGSVCDFLASVAAARPLYLLLDDLHWADDSTLGFVRHLAQRSGEMAALVVATYRDVELDVSRPFADTLEQLVRSRLARRVTLRRLGREGVEAMLAGLGGRPAPGSLVDAIHHETEGNPFFVEEVFKHLSEEGRLFAADGDWRADVPVEELAVPESIRLVIGRRLERLGDDTRRVLTTAAIIGREFGFSLLSALDELDPDALLDAIDDAERAQLVVSSSDGPEARMRFAHELVRHTLLVGVSLPRRQHLHLRVAEALERVHEHGAEEQSAAIAHHLVQAGAAADAQKAVRYLSAAGAQALTATAFEDAFRHYDSALSLHKGERRERAALLAGAAQALRGLGRWDEALERWREALDVYAGLEDGRAVGALCAEVAQELAWAARWGECLEIAQRGLLAGGEGDARDRAWLLSVVGGLLGLAGSYEAGDEMVTEAVALAERVDDIETIARTLFARSLLRYSFARMSEAADDAERAAEVFEGLGRAWLAAEARMFIPYQLATFGRVDEASKVAHDLLPLAEKLGHSAGVATTRRWLSWKEICVSGDLALAERLVSEDAVRWTESGLPWAANSRTWMGLVRCWQGNWDEAEELLEEGVRLEVPGAFSGVSQCFALSHLAHIGRAERAGTLLDELHPLLPRPGAPATFGAWTLCMGAAEAACVLGRTGDAEELHELILEAIAQGFAYRVLDGRCVSTIAGMTAAATGKTDEALRHFETALAAAREMPNRFEEPDVLRFWGEALLAAGDRAEARERLEEALEGYRRIGMPRHVEGVERLIS